MRIVGRLNEDLTKKEQEEVKKILEAGAKKAEVSTDGLINIGTAEDPIFITSEDEEKYNAWMELANFVDIDEEDAKRKPDDYYRFPGFMMESGGRRCDLYLKKGDAIKIGREKAKKFENLLGVKFPQQVHQFRAFGKTMGDTSLGIPEPMYYGESYEDYEKRLKTHYGDAPDVGGKPINNGFRTPYIHETIDFRNDDSFAVTENLNSEYYELATIEYIKKASRAKKDSGVKNKNAEEGEEYTVENSEEFNEGLSFGNHVGLGLTGAKTAFKNYGPWVAGIAVAGLGFSALSAGISVPVSVIVGGTLATSGLILVGMNGLKKLSKLGSKAWNKVKEKAKDFIYGPKKKKDPTPDDPKDKKKKPSGPDGGKGDSGSGDSGSGSGTGGTGGSGSGAGSGDDVGSIDLTGFYDSLDSITEQYIVINNKMDLITAELKGMDPSSDDYKAKSEELRGLRQQAVELLNVMRGYYNNLGEQAEKGRGSK